MCGGDEFMLLEGRCYKNDLRELPIKAKDISTLDLQWGLRNNNSIDIMMNLGQENNFSFGYSLNNGLLLNKIDIFIKEKEIENVVICPGC